MECLICAGRRVSTDDDDGLVRTAKLFPVGGFALVNFANLFGRQCVYRVGRMHDHAHAVHRYGMGDGHDAFFDSLLELLALHKTAHRRDVASTIDKGCSTVAAAGLFDRETKFRMCFKEHFREGISDRPDRR